MDHIPSLPRSHKGNTELLIFEDLFTGYVIAKASSSRTAQTVAESYEECVFRRFGASEAIRHDREPGFMSDFFRAFNKILGQRQLREDMIEIHGGGGIRSSGIINRFGNRSTNGCGRQSQIERIYTIRRSARIRSRSDLECGYIWIE
ncbi:Reverse transcriptase [Phytophthora palmivora]|uniref:Reverse transcriptase n=1 Tax=Phytophthora palmivora TaxID=4796 RepID=A0A2P4XWJ6_9STRA|nr:Reverse transcriptase [Phytophthora palmivora]